MKITPMSFLRFVVALSETGATVELCVSAMLAVLGWQPVKSRARKQIRLTNR